MVPFSPSSMLLCNKAKVHASCSSNIHDNSPTENEANIAAFKGIFMPLKAVT